MKKIVISLALITLIGCENNVGKEMPKVESEGIMFFKHLPTGLCFAKIINITEGFHDVVIITCVPCDSLKKIGLN